MSVSPPDCTNVVAIAAGSSHSPVLKADGTVVAFGNNDSGQTHLPANLSSVVAISACGDHSLALTADGRLVGRGADSMGETNAPGSLANILAIASGYSHCLALGGKSLSSSPGRLTHPAYANHTFSAAVPTTFGRRYVLEFENSLADPFWTSLPPAVLGDGSVKTLTDSSTASCFAALASFA